MDEKDAKCVKELIKGSILVEGFDSMHNIHGDKPKEYLEKVEEFLANIEK